MPRDESEPSGRQIIVHGTVIGLVAASHLALLILILLPPAPAPVVSRSGWRRGNVLRVELLSPPAAAERAQQRVVRARPAPAAALGATAPRRAQVPHAVTMQATLNAVTPGTAAAKPPALIAGGGFRTRLRAAQAAPGLPCGHHYLYLAADLPFIPIEEQSIEGKVHKIAGLLFGGFDPVCKNTQYELAKTRAQVLADGYTMADLERRLREHHCR